MEDRVKEAREFFTEWYENNLCSADNQVAPKPMISTSYVAELLAAYRQPLESQLQWLRANLCARHFDLYTMSSGDCAVCTREKRISELDEALLQIKKCAIFGPQIQERPDETLAAIAEEAERALKGEQ